MAKVAETATRARVKIAECFRYLNQLFNGLKAFCIYLKMKLSVLMLNWFVLNWISVV